MDLTKLGVYFGYNPTPVQETPPITTGNGWNVGATGGIDTIGGDQYGNFKHDPGLIARLDAFDNQQVRPTVFLGVTKDFYA